MFKIKTLNPQFEFQRDTLRHTIRDCFDFGKVVADIQVCTDICSVSFQYTFGESVINWTSDAVVPVSSVDFSYSYNFSTGLLSSSSTQHLFCEASKHLFTSKIQNICVSPIQQKQPTRGIISSNSNTKDVQETEEKRRNELQKKLADKLGKSKSKELKKHGIFRK
ncbi:hypothetical protein MS3_00005025 [Schistosoma haematobium]|uniref:Uncharacterized protein n=1 Tax=Schistosoma haematobium TaxID=6185 RepID=A0A922ITF2_SCHHA|nr:hypothetical protein MS3_00005025 [Schistosoma haematobium]KAH9587197.1 hypothetical protein MS3_00005025 [Schistosoma haematobium]